MTRILPVFGMIAASLAMVSCVNRQYQFTPSPKLSPAVASVDTLKQSVQCYTAHSRVQAINFCQGQLNAVAPSFAIDVQYDKAVNEMGSIAQELLDSGLAVAMEMENTGNRIIFTPEYSDCVLMLRAHRQPAFFETLPQDTQKALRKAQQLVVEVCTRYSSEYERAVALHDYIACNTRYESRLGIAAQANATTKLLLEGIAVCDGYAHAYGLLLSMAGIDNRFVVGKGDDVEHIWNMAKLKGQWVHIDVTYDDPKPDKPGRVLHSYFGMSDSRIASNHQWKRSDFPRAGSDALYHPFYMGYRFSTAAEMLHWAAAQRVGYPWGITVYVDELSRVRSESAAHARLQDAADSIGVDNLQAVALDKGCRGAVYCSFNY